MVRSNAIWFWPGEEDEILSTNFKAGEFKSKGPDSPWCISVELVQKLQLLRDEIKKSLRITSGFRTVSHNKEIGGAQKSRHLLGLAADIALVEGVTAIELAKQCYKLGFRRIGVANSFVHVDVDNGEAYWVYDKDGTSPAPDALVRQIQSS